MRKSSGLLLLTVACALAQGPPGKRLDAIGGGFFPWWDGPLVQDLNLNEEQRNQIRATVSEYRDRLIEQRANLAKAEGHLQDLMNEDPVNEFQASEAIEKAVAARGDLMRTFSQMSLKLRKVLTVQQWRELQKRRPRRWRRGPGGAGNGPHAGPP